MTLVKYTAIQLLAYLVDMFFYIGLINVFFMNPIISNVFGKIAAGIFAFYLHRIFTFNVKTKKFFYQQVILYFFILFLNIPLSSLILIFNLTWIPSSVFAKFISDIILFGLSYFFSKSFIFNDSYFRNFFK